MTRKYTAINNEGFTLIEVMIYVAIFALIVGSIVGLATVSSLQRIQNQAIAITDYQGEAVMSLIDQTIASANSVTTPLAGTSSSSLTLAMPTNSVNPTTFASFNDGSINRMQISEGSPAITNYLTNSRVVLSGLTFNNYSVSSAPASIQIKFVLTYKAGTAGKSYTYSKTFYGAESLP